MSGGQPVPTVTLRVRRWEAGKGAVRWESYSVPLADRTTVLDALFYVLREHDRTIAFRCACRAAMCGSCAMVVNGSEQLACKTSLASVAGARGEKPVRVEPLRNLPIVKDLVVDMEPFFEKYSSLNPWVVVDPARPEPAVVPPDDTLRVQIGEGLDCISCGACYSACPMVAADPDYLGPMQLLRAFSVLADEREHPASMELREAAFDTHGVWRCRGISECTRVCPKGLDPALAIRRLRRAALNGSFR